MIRSEGEKLKKVIVSSPKKEYTAVSSDSLTTHNMYEPSMPDIAMNQHNLLKSILADTGCRVIDLEELEGHPNSVFTRDMSVVTPSGFIQLRMGLPSRRGEEGWMSGVLDSLGIPCSGAVLDPASVEGGDVILAGEVAFLGRSGRTNPEGIRQISPLLRSIGFEVRTAAVPEPYLHLGGAMSLAGPETIICAKGVFKKGFFRGFETIEIGDGSFAAANVICLGDREVIAHSAHSSTIGALLQNKICVHSANLSEFIKGRGGPSCLILPIERGEASHRRRQLA